MSENLWVCDACEMIGTADEAARHRELTTWDETPDGHEVRELDAETSAAVRVEQRRQSIKRAADFIAFTRMKRGNRGAWR